VADDIVARAAALEAMTAERDYWCIAWEKSYAAEQEVTTLRAKLAEMERRANEWHDRACAAHDRLTEVGLERDAALAKLARLEEPDDALVERVGRTQRVEDHSQTWPHTRATIAAIAKALREGE